MTTESASNEINRSVGVIGAGTMGVGIAYVFAAAGFATYVVEPDAGRASELSRVVAAQAANGRERGKLTEAQSVRLPERVHRAIADSIEAGSVTSAGSAGARPPSAWICSTGLPAGRCSPPVPSPSADRPPLPGHRRWWAPPSRADDGRFGV